MNETDFKIYQFYQDKEKAYSQLINDLTVNGEVSEKQASNFMLKVQNFKNQNKDFLYMLCYAFYFEHNPNELSKEISKKFVIKLIYDDYPEETIKFSKKGMSKLGQNSIIKKDILWVVFLASLLAIVISLQFI